MNEEKIPEAAAGTTMPFVTSYFVAPDAAARLSQRVGH